jgi:hypothetical protein
MSKQTLQLLEAFESLPPEEKRVFTAEFLKRAIPFDSGPIEDREIGETGRSLFAMLDQEEDDARST